MRSRMWLAALVFTGCIPSFDGFALVDDGGAQPDSGALDAGAVDAGAVDAGAVDAGAVDAGGDGGAPVTPSRIDRACATRWTELGPDAEPPCDGRQVVTVGEPISSYALGIARAIDGTITVAYNEMDGPDFGRIVTVHFDENAPEAVTAGPTVEPEAALGDVVGVDLALVTEPPNIHHLAYWLRSDFGHQVVHRSLQDGIFIEEQIIASAVGANGVVDVAVDGDRRVAFGWHDDESGANVARRERADGTLTAPATVRRDGEPRLIGPGAVALAATSSRTVHMAFQWSITLAASAPSHAVSSGESWTTPTTLDNRAIDRRTSGVGVDITTVGETVVAAYLDWKDGVGEIRFARFSTGDEPMIERYLEALVIDAQPGRHPIAIATDERGLLHLAVAVPSASTTSIEYHRQSLVGGAPRWIVDTIDVLDDRADALHLDMKVGPDRRPHIVYWDPALGVRYATLSP